VAIAANSIRRCPIGIAVRPEAQVRLPGNSTSGTRGLLTEPGALIEGVHEDHETVAVNVGSAPTGESKRKPKAAGRSKRRR